jgi:DNA-binding CsgD family transcriptional regulator
MARPSGSGPLRVYAEFGDAVMRSRIAAEGIRLVDDPAEAEALLRAPAAARDARYSGLSAREAEILEYLADGWSNDEIADRLGISPATVKFHLSGVYRKLGVGRRTEAVREGLKLGIVEL